MSPGDGASFYICCNTSFLGSRGKIAQLDEHLAWVGVFMDLGGGHWLIFLPFTQISVGNCLKPNKLVSFPSNFKNKFQLWCWGRPASGDPYLHTTCSVRKGPWPWFGCSCFKEQRTGKRRSCSVSFTTPTPSLHISAIATVTVGARVFTDCTSTTVSLRNFRKPRLVKIHL